MPTPSDPVVPPTALAPKTLRSTIAARSRHRRARRGRAAGPRIGLLLAGVLAPAFALTGAAPRAQDWPCWRGPHWNGSAGAEARDLPTTFGPDENVAWSVELPGPGASTPAVVGDRIYLTAADLERDRLVALCLSVDDGRTLWSRDAGSGHRLGDAGTRTVRAQSRSNYASPSPSCDGEHVVFFFGNGDLVVYDVEGEERWRTNVCRDHGDFAFQWTFSASPTLYDGNVYVPVLQRDTPVSHGRRSRGGPGGGSGDDDVPIPSFVLCFAADDGTLRWKHVRPSAAIVESRESYTTVVPHRRADGSDELLLAGGDVLTAHDPATGDELWRWGTWNEGHRQRWWRLVPSVVVARRDESADIALVCAPKREPVYAIRLDPDAAGSRSDDEALVWQSEGRPNPVSSDVPTPAAHDGFFYVLSDVRRALSKVAADDGRVVWTTRLDVDSDDLLRASPLYADGRIWLMSHGSTVFAVDAESGDVVHRATMAEGDTQARSSLAVAHDRLFVRTERRLFCITSAR